MKLPVLTFAAVSTLGAASVSACAQNPTGAVRGVIEDPTGRPVAGASTTLSLLGSGVTATAVSNARGEYSLQDLTPGQWGVRVTSSGFAAAEGVVTVNVSTTRDLNIVLKTGVVQQSVSVSAESFSITTQPIDETSTVHQSVMTRTDLDSFPLPARSFANIALLAPGTQPVEPSDPTKARITAVSTGGSSGLNNDISVDGVDNSDDFIGGFLQNFSPDAIQEFAIRTTQEDADTGATTGGSVVITTRIGTDELHASGAVFERADALDARRPIENPAPEPRQRFSRQNYVGTVGGPLIRDRLFAFVAVESLREKASLPYSPANLTEFRSLAQLAGAGLIPGVPSIEVPSSVAIPYRDDEASARLQWTQSARSQWFLRVAGDTALGRNSLVQQGTLPSTGVLEHNNYLSLAAGNQFLFSPTLIGRFTFGAGSLHLTQVRNSNLGFALAFPFSSTSLTVSGFETFGDNQFATPITFFPATRNQQKYQARYDLSKSAHGHTLGFGVNIIHEPVLNGTFAPGVETLYTLPENPSFYVANPGQFAIDLAAGASTRGPGGAFGQDVQRLAFYAQDSWRLHKVSLNYGLRYSTTFGLLRGSGVTQDVTAGYSTLAALQIPLAQGNPTDDRAQFAPHLGLTWSPGSRSRTVLRGGAGFFFNDLAQVGWSTALEAMHEPAAQCADPLQPGAATANCVPGSSAGGVVNLIDPHYRTPYAIHLSAGVQHAFNSAWALSADFVHEQGNHGYRAYSYTGGENLTTPRLQAGDPAQADVVPDVNLFRSDNRSSYNALLVHAQGRIGRSVNVVGNYTLAKAQTWGCTLGEIFDYVNGVCDPLNAFAPGDYGPAGEDTRHRFVLAGYWKLRGGLELTGISQGESARPFTIVTSDGRNRISVNGRKTSLDEFRGVPFLQTDVRVSRPVHLGERWVATPFAEFFNVFNRNNPGANFVSNVASLAVPGAQAQSGNVTDVCTSADCTTTKPLTGLQQLAKPAGALGDFFGPGTTVGIPFAAQVGLRIAF